MALANFIVVEIMGRGDFDATSAEFRVYILVGDDGNLPPGDRQVHGLADQMLIAFVFRVDRHGGVPQHGFWARGGDHQKTRPIR